MRILFAIAHYFGPKITAQPGASGISPRFAHGSTSADPRPRIAALTSCVAAAHQLYGEHQYTINQETLRAEISNRKVASEVEVVICVTGDNHLLAQLPIPRTSYTSHQTSAHPPLLGYECHEVLRAGLAAGYDYFAYLEDDLILTDPWFFQKLRWFNNELGDEVLLQPNRYEIGPLGLVHKAYIDGNLPRRATAPFQNIDEQPTMTGHMLGTSVVFRRASNPHSGCFFLNREQMTKWSERPHFLDRSSAFVGPLESAATLGIMRAFRVYKPSLESASFLEIAHYGTAFLGQLRRRDQSPP